MIGYVGVPTCQLVTTGVYKITFPAAHPLGAAYIAMLNGVDGAFVIKMSGTYLSTSTYMYVRCLDGSNNQIDAAFTYIVL